jgi:hypothetical protein
MSDLRYPIGPFRAPASISTGLRAQHLAQLAALPGQLADAVEGLTPAQLDTPYRPGGWTVRQLVHHVPDSHLNAYVRHRLCATEENPTIRGYDQDAWVATPEIATGDLALPLALLATVHARWLAFLTSLPPAAFARTFVHSETGKTWTLDESVAMYAWHGRHHLAHVTELRRREGW